MSRGDIHEKLRVAVDANWDRQIAWLKTLVSFPSLRRKEAARVHVNLAETISG